MGSINIITKPTCGKYDYSGVFLRRTHTDYANATNLINALDYTTTAIHLRSLPTKQWVSSDALGTSKKALTIYEYDNYTLDAIHAPLTPYIFPSEIFGLDPGYTASYTKRGNVTSLTRYSNAGSATGAVTGALQYDIAGNVVKSIDPRSTTSNIIATSFDYSDRFGSPDDESRSNTSPSELIISAETTLKSYGFPTKVTDALGYVTYTQYNYYLGAPVNSEDRNEIVSSTEYGNGGLDLLDRPSRLIRAINNTSSKSKTEIVYDDVTRVITTKSDLTDYDDKLLKSQSLYDGLGRTVETRTYETSTGYITSKQEYDALGRVKRSYNPYRATADSTDGWTDYTYDEFSRVKKVETFTLNGTSTVSTGLVTTEYNGDMVLVTDQETKKRLSRTNSSGQLTDVWEITTASGSVAVSFGEQSLTGYLTHYDYDVLNDMTTVTQGSQTPRVFAYNSLKQLTDSTNPESGHVSYEYDKSGNLSNKTDVGRSLVTTYVYDKLNRLTTRTYSDSTPAVSYWYDSQTLPTGAPSYDHGFATGRLLAVTYGSGSSAGTYSGYDALGRVLASIQTTDGIRYPMSYEYDLAGNLKKQIYPSGRVVATEYDSASRIAGVKKDATTYYAGAGATDGNRIQYSAHGAVSKVLLGNGLWEHANFNSRLQVTQIGLGTESTNASVLQLDYSYQSNGNLQSQTINGPNLWPLVQNYTYDSLNRLLSAREERPASECPPNNLGTHECWKQTFSYDRYGNRRFDAAQSTLNYLGENPSISLTNNQISAAGYRYDAAGNLECDPMHPCGSVAPYPAYYAYDAENRMKSAGAASYSYDGDGRRVKKTVGTETSVFAYNVMGQLIAEYGTSPGWAAGGTSYLTADHLGTPRVITRQDKSVKVRRDYLPFGEEIIAGTGGRYLSPGYAVLNGTHQQFTSKERDNETQLDFFFARYYSAGTGRFTSADSMAGSRSNPQTLNLYAYVQNNPLAFTDPTGHQARDLNDWAREKLNEIKSAIWRAEVHAHNGFNIVHSGSGEEGSISEPQDPVTAAGEPPRTGEIVSQMNTVSEQQVREFNGSTCVGKSCDCVPLVKALTDTNEVHTSRWREGEAALGNELPYGPPIATFINGRYPSLPTGNHAAFLLGQVPRSREHPSGGILALDQFSNRGRIGIRVIENREGRGSRSNDASRFSVIWIAPPPETRRR